MAMLRRAFISYSSADAPIAQAVADACEKAGASVFLDRRSLQLSNEWYTSIKTNLADADVVFVLVSEASLKSRYVNQEIGMASQAGAKVVPLFLVVQEGLPTEIARLHGASIAGLRGEVLDARIAELLAASEREAIDLPPAFLDRLCGREARTASAFLSLLPAALKGSDPDTQVLMTRGRAHGSSHVGRLLNLTEWALDEVSRSQLSEQDIFALIVAVVMRERVLYMPLAALQELLCRSALPPIVLTEDLPVQRLWQNFVQRSRYEYSGIAEFERSALLDLALEEAVTVNTLALPMLRRFVLEYQGRLAHEAASVPPRAFKLPLVLSERLPGRLGALVPLLARADEEALRELLVAFSGNRSIPREVEGAKPALLAAGLRCAMHLDRFASASGEVLRPKPAELAADAGDESTLRSLTELRHDRLTDARVLHVDAHPESAFAYQEILAWTRALQSRLDECWAVLGHVYGDGRFGLKLRTASTPLADPARARFDKSLPFVPQLARLRTASSELIRLLTSPLYGDKPEVGVRELLQNALDAVRERAHWPATEEEATESRLGEWHCDVLINLMSPGDTESHGCLEIVDSGVGMTPETIRDYFLRVGASLRQDADWLQRFPAQRQAQMLRSGRFGIGTLAAYLLGSEVHVTSRHVTELDGMGTKFVARLSDAPIELLRVPAPIGTSIRIPVPPSVYSALTRKDAHSQWDWFALQSPRVVRAVDGNALTPAVSVSDEDLTSREWHQLSFEGLERVFWRPATKGAHQRLWCNGLLVEDAHETMFMRRFSTGGPCTFECADVMVFDGRATLPLAVTRDRLEGRAPYHDQLLRDFLLDHCAWLLACAASPMSSVVPPAPMWRHFDGMSPGDGWIEAPPYMEVEDGLLPWREANIAASGIATVVAFDGRAANSLDMPQSGQALAHLRFEIYGGFGPESRVSVATRHMRDFVRAVVPAASVHVLTSIDDEAFRVVGIADGVNWRSDDARVEDAIMGVRVSLAS